MADASTERFHWADYVVFSTSLAIGIVVGIVFAVKDKWLSQSTESYLMAERRMSWIPVGLSFWATVVSAGFFIGLTTEFYFYGTTIVWVALSRYIGASFTILIVIPKFYRMGFAITSAYEYFERRFNYTVRVVVGLMFIIVEVVSMSVTLYGPSLVLAKVSDISLHWCIFIGGFVCMIYTAFGGMKAVIWVDSIQIFIMTLGMCFLAGYGTTKAGGIEAVWRIYGEIGQRDNWDDLNARPWDRHNVWNVLFLHAFMYIGLFSTSQSVLQRYLTVPRMAKAQRSVLLGVTIGVAFTGLVTFVAMAAFALVGGNDPLLTGKLSKPDQILPYFLMFLLGDYHGLPGLVVASLYAAALSTLSSAQNAMSAVLTEDFVSPIYKRVTRRELKEKSAGFISRMAGVVVGVSIIVLALGVPYFKDTLLSLGLSITSFFSGPVLGLIIVGFFFFWVESWGALSGLLCSLAWAVMLYGGAMRQSDHIGKERKPLFMANFTETVTFPDPDRAPTLFDVSYTWYVFIDILVVVIVSSVVSLIIHACRHKGELRRSVFFTDTNLLYTLDDLKAAVGYKHKEVINITPYVTSDDDDMTPSAQKNDVIKRSDGVENIAYEMERF